MDEGDRAKDWADQQIEDALAAHRHKGGHPADSLVDCEVCGAEIPIARRRVVPGCRRCIDCQRELELAKGRK